MPSRAPFVLAAVLFVSGSFDGAGADAAPVDVEPAVGDTVTVVLRSGDLVQGRLLASSADSLTVERAGTRGPFYDPVRVVARADVAEILPGIVRPRAERRSRHGYVAAGGQWISRDEWGGGFQIRGGFEPASFPFSLGFELGFAELPSQEAELTDLSRTFTGIYSRPDLLKGARWTSHAVLAAGFASTIYDRSTFPHPPTSSGSYVALGAGGGRKLGAWTLFVEARYDAVFSGGGSYDFTAASIGLRR